jgi:DNA-directed RNA polymerase specialized sigma24 family protein
VSLDWTALSDGELAVLSGGGRQAAFAEIVRRHGQAVFRLVRSCVSDPDEALDLAQDTFLAAHKALSRYDRDRPMRTWLLSIGLNKCRDWGRKRMVRRFLTFAGPIDAEAKAVSAEQVGIDDAASDLRTIEGLSQSETAAVLMISEKAVETRLYRARTKLLEKLGSH